MSKAKTFWILLFLLFFKISTVISAVVDKETRETAAKNPKSDDDVDGNYIDDTGTRGKKLERSGPKVWDHWGKWSSCSASCGIGKITRWRHCVSGGCAQGEKEVQIKTCTQAAC